MSSFSLTRLLGSRVLASVSPSVCTSVDQVLQSPFWPPAWPYTEEDFKRLDETQDTQFYTSARFVNHIDDKAIASLTSFYQSIFSSFATPNTTANPVTAATTTASSKGKEGAVLLDLCSSWVSHYPKSFKGQRVVGMGMNQEELSANKALTETVVNDLNVNPKLPFEDNTFDVVTNTVSVDYLIHPLEVFKEINRVLKPGGVSVMSFSNRCFPTKVISMWLRRGVGELERAWVVGSYFHYAGGFEPPQAQDITRGSGDPMIVVFARKRAAASVEDKSSSELVEAKKS